eukprot:m.60369 g.60369  ORF g.60369 m.60369 type:complete len:679 (-) comp7939_c0_seq4:1784-3820(-)
MPLLVFGSVVVDWVFDLLFDQRLKKLELQDTEDVCDAHTENNGFIQLINNSTDVVNEGIDGLLRANSNLSLLEGHRVVIRKDIGTYKKNHVTLISGGGSGHEPAHAGFVGNGLLSAAVCGDVFSSPSTSQILAAILAYELFVFAQDFMQFADNSTFKGNNDRFSFLFLLSLFTVIRCAGEMGVVVIVKNYTGDRLNFGLAVERAKCEGVRVEMIVVADDCALPREKSRMGRRGVAGTLFFHKILGSMAFSGESIDSIVKQGLELQQYVGTVGVALSACRVPGVGPSFQLPPSNCGLGVGIHGEAGVANRTYTTVENIARDMISLIFNQDKEYGYVPKPVEGDEFALLLNNLGGSSILELNVTLNSVLKPLNEELNLKIVRVYMGSLMTSIDMQGFSISLLNISAMKQRQASILMNLDNKTEVVAWNAVCVPFDSTCSIESRKIAVSSSNSQLFAREGKGLRDGERESELFLAETLRKCCEAVIAHEPHITQLDMIVGDGDCGTTMLQGATAILSHLEQNMLALHSHSKLALQLSDIVERSMGGTSGAVYSIFFSAISHILLSNADLMEGTAAEISRTCLGAGVEAIVRYGGASEGDRTMLDVLIPVHRYLVESQVEIDWEYLNGYAHLLAMETANLQARSGRSSYLPSEILKNHADPGAVAASVWLQEIFSALHEEQC